MGRSLWGNFGSLYCYYQRILQLKTSEVLRSGVRQIDLGKLRKSVLLLSAVAGIRDVRSFEVGDKASRFGETSEVCRLILAIAGIRDFRSFGFGG